MNFKTIASAVSDKVADITDVTYKHRDWALAEQLRTNAAVFAAFKNHKEAKELINLITDNDGKIRSFSEFKKLATPITEQYNKNWLRTEYDQALSSAEIAKKWNGFISDKDLYPNLEYVAVMDSQTRSSHAALNGTIRPVDDPFWDSHYPPNGWGCRCDVVQTDKPANKAPDLTPDKGFNNNPGKSGKLFSDDAGYYDVSKEEMNEVNQHANELLKANIIKEATEILTNKFVRSGNLKIAFSEEGIKTTANINKKTKAMALLLNNDNIQQLIDAAEKHIVKGDVHIWTGEDAGISFEIKATETSAGTLIFDYVKIK